MPLLRRQLALQLTALLIASSLAWPYYLVTEKPFGWHLVAILTGCFGGLLSLLSKQPRWWTAIHCVFMPLAWYVSSLDIPPGWFLLGFITLLLFYRGAVTSRVPLYLSNRPTATALIALAQAHHCRTMIDLGAGFAGIVSTFNKQVAQIHASGVENAPLSWLIGAINLRLFTPSGAQHSWHYGSFWNTPLSSYDLVYCFLSPEPMPALWEKARQEMQPGSLFVSNSFPIPDIAPTTTIDVEDGRCTTLYCYQL